MRYHTSRIKEIRDEIKELREDDDSDDKRLNLIIQLIFELKDLQKIKKDTSTNWSVVTEAEEVSCTLRDVEEDDSRCINMYSFYFNIIHVI